MESLNGKTALVTGGSRGIGLGIAKSMVESGLNVMITGTSETSISNGLKLLEAYGDRISATKCDVRNVAEVEITIEKTIAKYGKIDVLVANAGVGIFASIEDLTHEQWNETIDINLTGVFNTVKACVEALKTSKGYFISISSLAGTNFFANGSAYNASKFGLTGFTQAVMLDLRKYGIKTTTIMPGSVATEFNNHVPSDKDNWKIQIEDLGQIVVDLLKMNPRTLPSKVEVRPTTPG